MHRLGTWGWEWRGGASAWGNSAEGSVRQSKHGFPLSQGQQSSTSCFLIFRFFLQHLLHQPIPLSLFQPFCCLRRVKQAGYDLDLRSCYFLYRLTWKVKLFYLNRWDIFTCEILCQKAEWEYPISVSIHARRTFGHTGFVIGRRQQSLPRVKRLSPPPYSSNAEACEPWECKASGNSHHDPPICVMQEVRWRRGPGSGHPSSFVFLYLNRSVNLKWC